MHWRGKDHNPHPLKYYFSKEHSSAKRQSLFTEVQAQQTSLQGVSLQGADDLVPRGLQKNQTSISPTKSPAVVLSRDQAPSNATFPISGLPMPKYQHDACTDSLQSRRKPKLPEKTPTLQIILYYSYSHKPQRKPDEEHFPGGQRVRQTCDPLLPPPCSSSGITAPSSALLLPFLKLFLPSHHWHRSLSLPENI